METFFRRPVMFVVVVTIIIRLTIVFVFRSLLELLPTILAVITVVSY